MPKYRISAQVITGRKTVGYKTSKMEFTPHIGDAYLPILTPVEAVNWLGHTWQFFSQGWSGLSSNHIWKKHGLDQVRLVLEEIELDGSGKEIKTTADWDNMPTVTSGGATP